MNTLKCYFCFLLDSYEQRRRSDERPLRESSSERRARPGWKNSQESSSERRAKPGWKKSQESLNQGWKSGETPKPG